MVNHIAKINNAKYSQEGAFDYLSGKWHKIRIQKSLEMIHQYAQGKTSLRALDIGCGDGAVAKYIKDLGCEVHGMDISSLALNQAETKGIYTKIGNVQEKLPYDQNYFDVVFAGEVIEHIADPRYFICEVNRIIKKDGLFVVTTPNLAGLDNRFKLLFGKIPRCIDPLSSHHYQHVRPFTFESLKQMVENGGFTIRHFTTNRIKTGIFGDWYFLNDLLPSIGATLIIGCVKKEVVSDIELNED